LSYGYPDPTYFSRVKLELADKGIFIEENEDVSKIVDAGSVHVNNQND